MRDERGTFRQFEEFTRYHLRHTKGEWAGRPFRLEPWQRAFWREALELDPFGRRVYQEVGFGLPRKNGKSTMASAAALFFLLMDGEAEPEVYVAAPSRAQAANIVFGQARHFVQQAPYLGDYVRVLQNKLECGRNSGLMRPLSSDAGLQHGLNPSANIIDEIHAHKTPELYTALTTGTGARQQPFTLWISTAGVVGDGILGDLYQQMFDGSGQLEERGSLRIYRDRRAGVLIYWYGAPSGADIEDPAVWKACNPARWFQTGRALADEFHKLKARGALLEWRRYHLNQFVGIEESWLPEGAWAGCADTWLQNEQPAHPLRTDLPIGVGIDKGQTSDLSAIVVSQRQGDSVVVRSRVFPPHSATGRVNTEAMRVYLRELRTEFPLPMARDEKTNRPLAGPAFAFDRWSFSESAEDLEQEGLNMVDFPQIAATLGPASTQAYELITTGRVIHDGDPVLAEHIANTTAILTDRGMKVTKPKKMTSRKNDAAIAMVMSIAMAMLEAPKPFIPKPRVGVGF